jgi:hypothetical protein
MGNLADILKINSVNTMWFNNEGSLVWTPEKPSFSVVDDPFLLEALEHYGFKEGQFLKQVLYNFRYDGKSFWFEPRIKSNRVELNRFIADLFTLSSSSKKVRPTGVRMGVVGLETAAFCSGNGGNYAQVDKRLFDYFRAIGFNRVYSQRGDFATGSQDYKGSTRVLAFFKDKKPIGAICPIARFSNR